MSVDALAGHAKFVATVTEPVPVTVDSESQVDMADGQELAKADRQIEHGIDGPVYAEVPVRAMEFGSVVKRPLPKLGRGESSLLAEGKVSQHGISLPLGAMPNSLNLFRMIVGNQLGPLKGSFETFEKALAVPSGGPIEIAKAMFKATVKFGEDAKQLLALIEAGLVDPPTPGFVKALSGLIDQVGVAAATLNDQDRLSKAELTSRVNGAEKVAAQTAQVIMSVNAGSLAKQVHDGSLCENVRELLNEHGYVLKQDTGLVCDAAGKALSGAEIDALGDQLVTWATEKLAVEEDRLTEAERAYIGGLSDQEMDTYAELRADYEDMKKGIPPRTQREAISQAYLKVTAEYGPDAIDMAFLDRLYSPEGVKDDGSMTPAQAAFVAHLGTYATLSNGAFHLSANPEARTFIKKAVTLVTHPSTPAAAHLMTAFFKTVKAFTDVVKVATSLGRDPYVAIAKALPNLFEGFHIGKLGRSRRAERLKGAPIVVKKKAAPKQDGTKATTTMPAAAPTPGPRTVPLTVGPLGSSAKAAGHALWNRIFDSRQDDLRDANKRMIKARLSATRQEILTKQEAYDLSVKAVAAKVHAEKAAK